MVWPKDGGSKVMGKAAPSEGEEYTNLFRVQNAGI